jgi:hypothetical protein
MIRERCSCGAEIETDEAHPIRILNGWRQSHKCQIQIEQRDSTVLSNTDVQATDNRSPEFHIGFRPEEEEG